MRILMAAAENDALPGGKVGGIGDVVRDAPPALAALGHAVDVVTPGYGHFSQLPGAERTGHVAVWFRGRLEQVQIFRVPGKRAVKGVTFWALEHQLFSAWGAGRIYCDDGPDRPFATDASKFALFCAALGQAIQQRQLPQPEVLHLHDWHTATLAVLRAYHPGFRELQQLPVVYTIHNLALQGTRPQRDDDSALLSWFPGLEFDDAVIHDPAIWGCYNPVRAAINLSDRVHVVSPTYAAEIVRPSEPWHGFFGGEGLEGDLRRADREGRLHGILNGCEYPGESPAPTAAELFELAGSELLALAGKRAQVDSAHLIALRRLDRIVAGGKKALPRRLLTSVGRITDQKLLILRQRLADNRGALEHLLDALAPDELMILLGSGDPALEAYFTEVAGRHRNFLFLKGFSDPLARALYAAGDLFLMPSSFEPCGISQMLAMREGQPCLVHRVGGLADTVQDDVDGFAFSGDSPAHQAEAMLARLGDALSVMRDDPTAWDAIRARAAAARFHWSESATRYVDLLYTGHRGQSR